MQDFKRYLGAIEAFLIVTAAGYTWAAWKAIAERWPIIFWMLGIIILLSICMTFIVMKSDPHYG